MLRRRLQAASREGDSEAFKAAEDGASDKRSQDSALPGQARSKQQKRTLLDELVLGAEDVVEGILRKGLTTTSRPDDGTNRSGAPAKQPAWQDKDDDADRITLTENDFRYKKVRKTGEASVQGALYLKRLKAQFEKTVGGGAVPRWAQPDFKPDRDDDSADEATDEVQSLYSRTGNFIAASDSLPQTVINIKRCTDANAEQPARGRTRAVEFHKRAQVVLVGGMDHSLSLFQVDGKKNPKIQSVFLERFPVHCAHFSASGEEVIAGSRHKTFYYYDMIAGKVVKVPPVRALDGVAMGSFEVSPCGRYLAFLGRHGHVHVLSAKSKEWLFDLKMNGSVEAAVFSADGSKLYSTGDDGMIYVWDMTSRMCLHKFYDDGCVKGTALAASRDGRFLACGSYSGVVNVYDCAVGSEVMSASSPKPLKSLLNLVTPCTSLAFNGSGELLAMASDHTERALKLVHVPTLTVFSNFPERTEALRIPLAVDFSPSCGYMAVGDHRGQALLYRLKHYTNY